MSIISDINNKLDIELPPNVSEVSRYHKYKLCIDNWKVENYEKHKQHQKELYQRNLNKPGFREMMRERSSKNRANNKLAAVVVVG